MLIGRLLSMVCAVVIMASVVLPVPALSATSPQDLTYLTEEYFPFNYTQDGVAKGISPDLLRAVWREMGVKPQPILVLPWARGYQRIQQEKNTVLFSMARTPERETMFKWVGPIYVARFVLISKRGGGFNIHGLRDLQGMRIGTLREDVSDALLDDAKSFARVEAVSDMSQNLSKLLANRLDMIAYEENAWWRMAERNDLSPEHFEVVYVIRETPVYYAFHPSAPQSLIDRFQQALDTVRNSPEYEWILRQYLH